MEMEFLMLSDYVEALNQKLYVMGGAWNQINAPSFPHNQRMGIAVSIICDAEEAPLRFPLRISIYDVMAERLAIPEITGDVAIEKAETGTRPRILVAINVGFPVPGPGQYRVTATIEPNLRKETYFDARLSRPLS